METIHNFRKNKQGYFMAFVQIIKRGKNGRFQRQEKMKVEYITIGLLTFICFVLIYKLIQLH